MDTSIAVTALAALAHPDRLELFRLLVRRLPGRVTPSELVSTLELGPSLISAHLRVLGQAGLLSRVRQGRSLRYRAEIGALDSLARFLVEDCCRGRAGACTDDGATCCSPAASDGDDGRRLKVLFLDGRDAVRAVVAEVVLASRHPDRCRAFSAGTARARKPRRNTLEALRAAGYDASTVRPCPIGKLTANGAPDMDVVVTLSREAASPADRRWRGSPVTSHWDAFAADGNPPEAVAVLVQDLERCIDAFACALDNVSDRESLQRAVDDAGAIGALPERHA